MCKTNLRCYPFICIADYEELRESNKLTGRGLNPVSHACDEEERIT